VDALLLLLLLIISAVVCGSVAECLLSAMFGLGLGHGIDKLAAA